MPFQEIRIIVTKGEHAWVAQGLECDVAAQGDSIEAALQSFARTVVCEMENNARSGRELMQLPRAPQWCFDAWERAQMRPLASTPKLIDYVQSGVPEAWMINKIGTDARVAWC